jgi:predicted amino acid-binding ACT domain protein
MQIAINIVNVLQYLERGFITLCMYTNVLITRDINSAINMMMTKYQNNQLGI